MTLGIEERRRAIGLLARAEAAKLSELWRDWPDKPAFTWLRKPESGLVMVRGRMGGEGAAFNLGEMTVTRCALRLGCGTVGHGYVQGRGKEAARVAALCDAVLQTAAAPRIEEGVIAPLKREKAAEASARAARAAGTKVDFFPLARGEG